MRKLFYAFLVAAAALLGSCTTDEFGPAKEFGEEDFSVAMNYCEVHYRGEYYGNQKQNYVVFFETQTAEGETTRRVAFDIFADAENVSADNVPLGTFSVADGTMVQGEGEGVFGGSYYFRLTESPYWMLIEDATLTIAQEGDEYVLTAHVGGNVDLGVELEEDEEPELLNDVDCRFQGTPVMSGLKQEFNKIVPALYVVYYDEVAFEGMKEKLAEWTFVAYDYYYAMITFNKEKKGLPAYASQFTVYTELPEDDEKVLPFGNYEIDGFNTGYLKTALGTSVGIITDKQEELVDDIYSGKVSVQPAEGTGNYTIKQTMYGFYDAYTVEHTGTIVFVDNTELNMTLDSYDAESGYNGIYLDWQENVNGDHWIFTGLDSTNGAILELHMYPTGEFNVKSGVPSGEYIVGGDASTENAIAAGKVDEEGYVSGSVVYDAEGNIVSLLQGGTMTLINSGSGTYSVVFDFTDQDDFRYFGTGRCDNVTTSYPSEYKLTQATGTFVGDGGWFLDFTDVTKGITLRTLVIGNEDITFADGIPAEKFRFDTSGNAGTAMAGVYVEKVGYFYSMVLAADGSGLYALLVDGEVEVALSGTTYTVKVNVSDDTGNIHRGTYEGRITTVDASESEEEGDDEGTTESSVAAKASLRQSAMEWSNFNKIEVKGKKFVGKTNNMLRDVNFTIVK